MFFQPSPGHIFHSHLNQDPKSLLFEDPELYEQTLQIDLRFSFLQLLHHESFFYFYELIFFYEKVGSL